MSAKVKVFAFDALGAVFADVVTFGIEYFRVALPVISVEAAHVAGRQLIFELSTTGIGAASQNKSGNVTGVSGNVTGVAVEAIPQPVLLLFILHKTPLLIYFQRQNTRWHTRWHTRFRDGTGGLAQNRQHRRWADVQDTRRVTRRVTHSRTIEGHRHNHLTIQRVVSAIGVVQTKQKLLAARFAPIPLLTLSRCAILFRVARATPRTG